jgi:hypothetical protein
MGVISHYCTVIHTTGPNRYGKWEDKVVVERRVGGESMKRSANIQRQSAEDILPEKYRLNGTRMIPWILEGHGAMKAADT